MSIKSPITILSDVSGNFAVKQAGSSSTDIGAVVVAGSDGSFVRLLKTTTDGMLFVTGSVLSLPSGVQSVTGSVSVTGSIMITNLPLVQQVTGTIGVTGSVGITNFPLVQAVTGSVSVTGSLALSAPITGSVTIQGTVAHGSNSLGNPVQIAGLSGSIVRTPHVVDREPVPTSYGFVTRDLEVTRPTFYVVYDRITMSAAKYMATLFNTSSTRKAVIQRIWVINWQFDVVGGNDVALIMYRITARTAGTSVTPRAEDTADILDAGITADTNSSAVSTSHMIMRIMTAGDEIDWIATQLHTTLAIPHNALRYERRKGQRGITLRQNQGVAFQFDDGDTDGTISFVIEFTEEEA